MAAVIDIDTEFRARAVASIDAGATAIVDAAGLLGPTQAVAELQRVQRLLAGVEHRILAEHITADGNSRDAEKLLRGSKTSRRSKRRKIERAKAVGQNPTLGAKLANDELSEEQLDLIAEASDKSNGDAATDSALIDEIAAADPDAGRAIKDDWLAKRATATGAQTEHDRQRALRRTQNFTSKKSGLDATLLEGDGVTQRAIRDAIRDRSKLIFERDGGRDLPIGAHPRTHAQRHYDAAYELICGVTTRPDGSHLPQAETAPEGKDVKQKRAAVGRPRIVIGLGLDEAISDDPSLIARQIGLGVIPQSVLANYVEHADFFAALYDRNGEPLWLARLRRHATATQHLALTLRDRGCVQCGAAAAECDVHHRIPWSAPAKGETNLNNLVLLCRRCHTDLHAQELTLYQHPITRHWHTRPATPNELPPPRPQKPPRQHHPPPQQE